MTSVMTERVAGREPESVTDARLARLAVVCGHRNALDAELVELTGGQLDAGIGGQGFVSMGQWVSHRTGMSRVPRPGWSASRNGAGSCR
jgi:hypothetical protein